MLGNKPPYTTMQQLNLDWVLSKLKTLLRLVPDDGAVGQILRRTRDGAVWSDEQGGGGGAVESVNGQTGAVVLDAADVGALPDDYTPPVTSVNGETGAVTFPYVSGIRADNQGGGGVTQHTGVVSLVGLGCQVLTEYFGRIRVEVSKGSIGLGLVANERQYSANNPPPYPVTSVNGQTGAVVIPTGGSPLDAYPVGAIYLSVNSTSPATLFGGTWEQLENRFLLGAGSDYTAGATGGEATHTLTINEMPSHNHGFKRTTSATGSGSTWARISSTGDAVDDLITNTGGGRAHNNMPPYLAVYMWKRTA